MKSFTGSKLKTSIFLKLFLVILVSGILIGFALIRGFAFAMRPKFDPFVGQNIRQYLKYLSQDLGEAPHFEKGAALAKSLNIGIRIEGQGWSWASSESLPPIASLPAHHHDGPDHGPGPHGPPLFPHLRPGPPGDEAPFEIINANFSMGPAKVLVMGPKRVFEPNFALLGNLAAFIALVLVVTYLLIRWIFSPIGSLSKGVSLIGKGNLDYRVPVESTDELGRLAVSFNEMVTYIQAMIVSKRQLLLDVSHELRSPLTRAKVALELLDENPTVSQIDRDLNELEAMIQTLLEEARLESGHGDLNRQACRLAPLVQEIVAEYADENKPVKAVVQEVLANVDPVRLRSVLRNLVDNSLKYSAEGKPVTVSLAQSNGFLRLEVRDEGIGIPAADLPKVFETFYRVDRSRARKTGGFGLGLGLCKRIVEAHGGTIQIESEVQKGTTIRVLIPLEKA